MFKAALVNNKYHSKKNGLISEGIKLGLSIFLLAQSFALQAESDITSDASSVGKTQQAVAQKPEVSDSDANESKPVAESKSDSSVRAKRSEFPRWPERKIERRTVTPPPPPGPYMSTALSDRSVRGLAFDRDVARHRAEAMANSARQSTRQAKSDKSSNPVDKFSPDRAWPSNLRPPHRWKPDDGYHFFSDNVDKRSFMPRMQYRYPGRNPAYGQTGAASGNTHAMNEPRRINPGMYDNAPGSMQPPRDVRLDPRGQSKTYRARYRSGNGNNNVRQPYPPVQGRP